jgi:hypothetical protein
VTFTLRAFEFRLIHRLMTRRSYDSSCGIAYEFSQLMLEDLCASPVHSHVRELKEACACHVTARGQGNSQLLASQPLPRRLFWGCDLQVLGELGLNVNPIGSAVFQQIDVNHHCASGGNTLIWLRSGGERRPQHFMAGDQEGKTFSDILHTCRSAQADSTRHDRIRLALSRTEIINPLQNVELTYSQWPLPGGLGREMYGY